MRQVAAPGSDRSRSETWFTAPLGEDELHEIVFGAVGKVWQPEIDWKRVQPKDFASFNEPGFAKIAVGFSTRSYAESRTLLSYEARTTGTDEDSRNKFRRYWWPV
jgi:hypothetical protein